VKYEKWLREKLELLKRKASKKKLTLCGAISVSIVLMSMPDNTKLLGHRRYFLRFKIVT